MEDLIPQQYAHLYEWEFAEDDDDVEVIFHFDSMFNARSIKFELSPKKDAISITIPNAPPLVHGKLTATVAGPSATTATTSLTLSFPKSKSRDWGVFISAPHPATSKIDPQSAFFLFRIAYEQEGLSPTSQRWLDISGSAGYRNALMAGWELYSQSEDTKPKAVEWLRVAATIYQMGDALLYLGILLMENEETRGNAFQILQQAVDAGKTAAKTRLAQLLSPLSEYPFESKDPQQAVALLQSVKERTPNDYLMCHELSKLYFNGIGVEKDVELAKELDRIAREMHPELPSLSEVRLEKPKDNAKEGATGLSPLAIVLGIGLVAAFTFGLFGWVTSRRPH